MPSHPGELLYCPDCGEEIMELKRQVVDRDVEVSRMAEGLERGLPEGGDDPEGSVTVTVSKTLMKQIIELLRSGT